jgi:hypothetical protein
MVEDGISDRKKIPYVDSPDSCPNPGFHHVDHLLYRVFSKPLNEAMNVAVHMEA